MADAGYRIQEESLIRTDIEEYLKRHETKDLLRFLTCGSVDDGKSTLIGRLLYDSHMIYEDQLDKVAKDSKVFGTTEDGFDPALLTDGLKAEREQGITIDVAYRFFSTSKRKFIVADTPGHEQYTRNMATGASTAEAAVILIDARLGVSTQTRRHAFITSLVGIKHVLLAVNKIDLKDYSQQVFEDICADFAEFSKDLGFDSVYPVPISALKGDNITNNSERTPWYEGMPLLTWLETLDPTSESASQFRFPVQRVARPDLDFRGYAGTICSGRIRVGDEIVVVPSVYPSGGEKQLIQLLTGKAVPSHGLPSAVGVLCQNVATAAAVASSTSNCDTSLVTSPA